MDFANIGCGNCCRFSAQLLGGECIYSCLFFQFDCVDGGKVLLVDFGGLGLVAAALKEVF